MGKGKIYGIQESSYGSVGKNIGSCFIPDTGVARQSGMVIEAKSA